MGDTRRAFFGARNGKIPGSGVLCATDETTCEELDPRLECQSDPADTAAAGYPSGDCDAKRGNASRLEVTGEATRRPMFSGFETDPRTG